MAISDLAMSTCSTLNPISDHRSFSPDSLLSPTAHNTILLLNCSTLNPISDHRSFSPDSLLPPTAHNTILLLNCSQKYSEPCKNTSSVDCQALYGSCPAFDGLREQVRSSSSSPVCCATDFQRLGKWSLKDLQCLHYECV